MLLYVFIWRIVRTASRDLRLPQESFVLTPGQAQAAGLVGRAPAFETGRLVVVASPSLDTGLVRVLDSAPVTMGRGAQNDLALDSDDFASARHAQDRAAPRRRLARGRRLDQRDVRERRAGRQGSAGLPPAT